LTESREGINAKLHKLDSCGLLVILGRLSISFKFIKTAATLNLPLALRWVRSSRKRLKYKKLS